MTNSPLVGLFNFNSLLSFSGRRRASEVSLEQQHTHPNSSSCALLIPKGKCWCCWEEEETAQNPLIRVCRGCKDPDLQWIHQVCINKYLTGLPHAMNRRELMEEQQQQLQEQQNSSSSSSSVDGCTVVEMDLEEDLLETTKLLPRPSSPTTITGSPSSSSPTASTPSTSSSKPRTPDYFCTRCKDAYTVRHTPIHPLFILSTDAFLVFAMVLMTICMAVLTTCCSLLIFQHWSSGQILFDFGGYIRISMNSFAVTMLLFCHSVNAVTWSMVISHCSGRTEKWVVGIDDDEEEEVLDEQETASTSL